MKNTCNTTSSSGVRKGAWTEEEDLLLRKCIHKYGEGKWHLVPVRAGLNRCRKSCRLRWLNYLRPRIKRGDFSLDEIDLILRLHKLLGNRWSLIAGRLPGRTANDIKNYWNTHLFRKKLIDPHEQQRQQPHQQQQQQQQQQKAKDKNKTSKMSENTIKKPRPRTFVSKKTSHIPGWDNKNTIDRNKGDKEIKRFSDEIKPKEEEMIDDGMQWWPKYLLDNDNEIDELLSHEKDLSTLFHEEIVPLANVEMQEGEIGPSDFSVDSDIWDLLS